MSKLKISKSYRQRLDTTGPKHGFATGELFAQHLIERGLRQYSLPDDGAPLDKKLAHVVDELGYSSNDELLEHLLERGLRVYEEPEIDPAKLEARLRGLGYID